MPQKMCEGYRCVESGMEGGGAEVSYWSHKRISTQHHLEYANVMFSIH